jgi:hypothetical protein
MTMKTKEDRFRAKESHKNQCVIDPDNFYEDPMKAMSKDLTKPVWNCQVKVDPTIVYEPYDPEETYPLQMYQIKFSTTHDVYNWILDRFLTRYKY